jgi:Right handed beta helix region
MAWASRLLFLALAASACRAGPATNFAPRDLSVSFDLTVPPGCSSPVPGVLYVSPETLTPGAGSVDCPMKVLGDALQVATSGTTVIVQGGASIVAAGLRLVPDGVIVTGGTLPSPPPGPFAACDANLCADAARWPLLLTDGSHPGFTLGANSALRFFRVSGKGVDASVFGAAGVMIPGAGAKIDHLSISGCLAGISVESGGSAEVDDGVDSSGNLNGLVSQTGSAASILGAANFDHNDQVGILVLNGALAFTLRGAVSASYNGQAGLRFGDATAGSSIDGLVAHDNLIDGLHIFSGSAVVVRNCQLHDNHGSGVSLSGGTGTSLSAIDLGMSGDSGRNHIYGNAAAGLCLPKGLSNDMLRAEGNDFTPASGTPPENCAAAAATLSRATACATAVDVSDGDTGLADVAPCN